MYPCLSRSNLLVHDEDDDGNLRAVMMSGITEDCVKTSKEMFLSVFSAFSPLTSPFPGASPTLSSVAPTANQPVAMSLGVTSSTTAAHEHGKPTVAPCVDKAPLETGGIKVLALYHRAPITDEQAPSLHMFDALVRHFESVGS